MTPPAPWHVYTPSVRDDMRLAAWYSLLVRQGDLLSMVPASQASLSAFLASFQPPTVLWWMEEAPSMVAVLWFRPAWSAVQAGVWTVRPGRRAAARAIEDALAYALTCWPSIIGLMQARRLNTAAFRMGFVPVGRLTGLWDGQDVLLCEATPSTFAARSFRSTRRSVREEVTTG